MEEAIKQNVKAAYSLASVTVRICDIGGWLDTWFAESGRIINLAVSSRPFGSKGEFLAVDVLFCLDQSTKLVSGLTGKVVIMAADTSFNVTIDRRQIKSSKKACRENLLLATLSLCELDTLPAGDLIFRIMSPIPPGASMGTSAAVSVALIKAVNHLRRTYNLPLWRNGDVAEKAFLAETKVMGGQSGTQDQWSAAFIWPAKLIEIERYPKTIASEIKLSKRFKKELENGLITVFVGRHDSSDTHLHLIKTLEQEGANSTAFQPIRDAVGMAQKAFLDSDLAVLGRAMIANTEGQRSMCSDLVGPHHQNVIKLAVKHACLGYKVNGAGGEGGSVTLLFKNRKGTCEFYAALNHLYPEYLAFEHQL